MITKQQALDLIYDDPIKIGQWVGFKDLTGLHNQWLKKFLFFDKDITLQGHRGSYKTTTLSLFLAIHTVIQPNEGVIFFRKTGGDVTEVIRQTGKILHSGVMNEIVYALYKKDLLFYRESAYEIQTNLCTTIRGASQLVGLGINTSITGKHADIVITDDIVNVNDRISQAERERTKVAYQELVNIKNRGGRFINTGTPWHKEDAFTLMPPPEKYDCYSTGLITPEKLAEIKRSMSTSLFAANYELKHIASEDALFPESAVFYEGDGNPLANGIAHIDAAYGGGDSTAFTIANKVGDTIYMFGYVWHCHVDIVLDRIIEMCKKYMVAPILCEKNADKGYLAKEIKRRNYPVRTYNENENKYLKIASYLRKWWTHIQWLQETSRDYLDEIIDYTIDAEHDDCPDSAACCVRWFNDRSGTDYESPFGG